MQSLAAPNRSHAMHATQLHCNTAGLLLVGEEQACRHMKCSAGQAEKSARPAKHYKKWAMQALPAKSSALAW